MTDLHRGLASDAPANLQEGSRVRYVNGIRESFFGKEGRVTSVYQDQHVTVYTVTFDDGNVVAAYPHNFLPLDPAR
jgi:hypothetical protein